MTIPRYYRLSVSTGTNCPHDISPSLEAYAHGSLPWPMSPWQYTLFGYVFWCLTKRCSRPRRCVRFVCVKVTNYQCRRWWRFDCSSWNSESGRKRSVSWWVWKKWKTHKFTVESLRCTNNSRNNLREDCHPVLMIYMLLLFICRRIPKTRSEGKKCHTKTMSTKSCLLWVDKTRSKDKTYKWVSVWWKTKN